MANCACCMYIVSCLERFWQEARLDAINQMTCDSIKYILAIVDFCISPVGR